MSFLSGLMSSGGGSGGGGGQGANFNQSMEGLQKVVGTTGVLRGSQSGSSSGTQELDVTQFDEEALRKLLEDITTQASQFTPEKGAEQAELAGKLALDDIMKQYLPQLQGEAAASGMYDSTTSQQLQNELAVRGMEQSQTAQTAATKEYANIYGDLSTLATSIAGMADKQSTTSESSSSSESKQRNESGSLLDQVFGGLFS